MGPTGTLVWVSQQARVCFQNRPHLVLVTVGFLFPFCPSLLLPSPPLPWHHFESPWKWTIKSYSPREIRVGVRGEGKAEKEARSLWELTGWPVGAPSPFLASVQWLNFLLRRNLHLQGERGGDTWQSGTSGSSSDRDWCLHSWESGDSEHRLQDLRPHRRRTKPEPAFQGDPWMIRMHTKMWEALALAVWLEPGGGGYLVALA